MSDIWIKLDVDFWSSPEVIEIGPDASILFLMVDSWCQKHQTDGIFSEKVSRTLFKSSQFFGKKNSRTYENAVINLVKVGWILEQTETKLDANLDQTCIKLESKLYQSCIELEQSLGQVLKKNDTEIIFKITNWEKHHRTKQQVKALKDAQSERKKRQRKANNDADVTLLSRVTTSVVTLPDTDTDTDKEKTKVFSEKKTCDKSVTTKKIPLPEDFIPDDFNAGENDFDLERFRIYHKARGSLFADWQSAWRLWISYRPNAPSSPPTQFLTAAEKGKIEQERAFAKIDSLRTGLKPLEIQELQSP